jgi:molecular chaperone DnaK (HSP70)
MRTEIFEPIICDVLDLVREQVNMAGNRTVAAVLLVGGFGASQYLRDRIAAAVRPIPVLQPENGWTAVVQGAAMIGLARANATLARVDLSARTARKHYGTELTTAFDPAKDDPSKKSVIIHNNFSNTLSDPLQVLVCEVERICCNSNVLVYHKSKNELVGVPGAMLTTDLLTGRIVS